MVEFDVKEWEDAPDGYKIGDPVPDDATPVDAASLGDLESRIAAAVDAVNTALGTKANAASLAGKLDAAVVGQAGGVAPLDGNGKVPAAMIPSDSGLSRGPWAARTLYRANDIVTNSGQLYTAADDHTSGDTFAGDLTTHWTLIVRDTGERLRWSALDPARSAIKGDGVTDDTQAIKDFINACAAANAESYFPKADYVSSWFYVNQIPRITGAPGAVIKMKNTNDAWNFGPTAFVAQRALTGDVAANGTIIPVDTTGLAADDLIQLGDTRTLVGWNVANNTPTTTALNTYRIKSIDNAGQLTLADPIIYPLRVSNGAFMNTLSVRRRGWVKGLHFESTQGQGAGVTASFLHFWYCRDLDVDVTANGFSNAGVIVDHCYDFRVRARCTNFADVAVTGITGQFGYGVGLSGASALGHVDIISDQCRHAISFAGTGHEINVVGEAHGCTSGAFDAHAGFTDVDMDVNVFGGSNLSNGVNLRGRRQRARVIADGVPGYGAFIFDNPQDVKVDLTSRNTGRAGVHVAAINAAVVGLDITADVQDANGPGIEFVTGGTYSDVRIDLKARNVVGAAIDLQRTLTRGRIELLVEDNQGSPTTTAGVNVGVAQNDVTADIEAHNSIPVTSGAQSGTLVLIGASLSFTPQAQIFTANGNYTVPAGATTLLVRCIGGGGGGGSGRVGAAGAVASGGGGGAGGGMSEQRIAVADVASPVAVTVGAGGVGGAPAAADATNGSNGTGGGASSFGTLLKALGGNPGSGGQAANLGTATGGNGMFAGAPGAGTTTTGAPNGNGANFAAACGAGGGGGSITTGDVAGTGGAGCASASHSQGTPGTGGAIGNSGAAAVAPANTKIPGVGGGGGGSAVTGAGAAGTNGAGPGGGGGGGGAARNGTDAAVQRSSGKGGDGQAGVVYVYAT